MGTTGYKKYIMCDTEQIAENIMHLLSEILSMAVVLSNVCCPEVTYIFSRVSSVSLSPLFPLVVKVRYIIGYTNGHLQILIMK